MANYSYHRPSPVYRNSLSNHAFSFRITHFSKCFIICVMLLVWSIGCVNAATYYSIKTGNWSDVTVWSSSTGGGAGAVIPGSGDNVVIERGYTVTVNGSFTCTNLTVGSPGNSNFGILTFSGSTPSLTVSGVVQLGGYGNTARTGTVTFISGSTLNAGSVILGSSSGSTPCQGIITMTAGGTLKTGSLTVNTVTGNTWTPGTGNVIMSATNTIPSTIFTTFNNLTCSAGNTTMGASLTINGNLNVSDGATFTVPAFTLSVTGATTVGNGTSGILNITSTTGTKSFTGAVTINSGAAITESVAEALTFGSDVTINSGGTLTENGNAVVSFAGNFTNSGSFTASSGMQTFSGTGKTIGGLTNPTTMPSVTFSGTYTNTCPYLQCLGTMIVTGTLTNNKTIGLYNLTGTGTLIQGTSSALLSIGVSITTITLDATTNAGNTVEYFSTSQNILPSSYSNLTITSGTQTAISNLTIAGNLTLAGGNFTAGSYTHSVGGNWINTGGTFTPGSSTVTFNGPNSAAINGSATSQTFNNIIVNKTAGQTLSVGGSTTTLNVGGTFVETLGNFTAPAATTVTGDITLTAGTFTAGAALTASGNWYNNGTAFTAGSGTVTMNGSSTKIIGGTISTIFNNLTLGPGAGQTYSLGYNQTVNGILNITNNSKFSLGLYNLMLGSSATWTGCSASNQCWILAAQSGQVMKMITANGSFTFPIGDAGTYSPITLNFTSGTYNPGAYVSVYVTNLIHPKNSNPVNYFKRYWTISQSGITSFLCNVTATFGNSDIVGGWALQNAAEYTGLLPWIGYSPITQSPAPYSLTANGVTALGDFTGMGIATFTTPTATLTGFTYAQGSGPSALQSFNLTGSNLSDNIIVTAPSDFEVCLSTGGTFVQSLPVIQTGGVVTNVPVYVRLKAGLNAANYTGETLTCTATGASTVNITVSGTVTPTTYCASTGDGSVYGITLVNFNTLNNVSTKSSAYTDYTSQSTNILTGSTYPLSVNIITSGSNRVYAKAWIDWNNNGNFNDAGETYDLGSTTTNGITSLCPLNITVPAGAVTGSTRMRVSCNFSSTVPGPCNSGMNGEVEDYTLNIYNPVIISSTAALSGFNYTVGSGPSSEQSFTITGTGIFDAITFTPPTSNFEISTVSGGVFQTTPITLTKDVNNKVNTTIYIRLKAGLAIGSYGPQNIVITSTNATTQNIACTGIVVPGITAGGGGSYCAGSTINLTSSPNPTSVTLTDLYWTGPNSFYSLLPSPSITNATTAIAGTYTVTGNYVPVGNLVTNGNFELGNTGFGSSYIYRDSTYNVNGAGKALWVEGTYSVCANPYSVHPSFINFNVSPFVGADHSSPGKLQMIINGATGAGVSIWSEPVTVVTNTNYQFVYWLQSVDNPTDAAPSRLQLLVNGTAVGPIYTANATGGAWTQYVYNWNSGSNTTAILSLVNQQTASGGNDFALDDIVFQPVYSATATVNVSVLTSTSPASVTVNASANPVFSGTNVTFTATPTNGGTGPVYQWSVNGSSVGTNSPVYTYIPSYGDVVSCSMTSNSGCLSGSNPVTNSVSMNVITVLNYWLGTNSTNWGTATNWARGTVPGTGDNVIFATTATYGSNAVNNLVLDADRTIGNLTNLSPVSLVIPPAKCLTVNGAITTNGASSPGSIYIQADHTGTVQNGSLIFSYASPVYGTVEMYARGSYNSIGSTYNGKTYYYSWQYFGIPVTTMTASPTFDGSYVRRWNESGDSISNHWLSLNNSSVLQPGIGYELTQKNPVVIVFQGQLVNWDMVFTNLPYTISTPPALFPGQSVLANPFTAAISIKQIGFGTNMLPEVYFYTTGSIGNWSSGGQYVVSTPSTAGNLGIPTQIPSMQGVVVQATANAAAITLPYAAIVKNTDLQRSKKLVTVSDSTLVNTRINVSGTNYSDKMWLFSQPGCTRNFDNGWDGVKMMGDALTPQIFAIEPDNNYQVDAVDDINNTILGFQAGADSEYTITFTHQNLLSKYQGVYLLDLVENKTTDMTESGSTYSFVAESTPTTVKRFMIITRPYEKDATDADTQIKVFSSGNMVFVQNLSSLNGEMMIYDMMGRDLKKATFSPYGVTAVQVNTIPGAYIVKAATGTEKVSKRIIIGN